MNLDLLIEQLSGRYGVNEYAVRGIWRALERSGGRSAQFSHPELGGYGQWMPGIIQIGDMTNDSLRDRVASICQELSDYYSSQQGGMPISSPQVAPILQQHTMKPMQPMSPMKPMEPMKAPTRWWPEEFGENTNAAGGQNEMRYAFFAEKRRLIVETGSGVKIYDTGDHCISGVQQHQHGDQKEVTFTSQHGKVNLAELPRV
jgi:hypothetical protein